jgi:hypothetical protein
MEGRIRVRGLPITVPGEFPSNVAAYWHRISERPGYVAAIARNA